MRRRILLLSTLAAAVLAVACGSNDSTVTPSAPASPASPNASLLSLGGTTVVTPVLRTKPLAQSIAASATVGPLGGAISIPGAGVLVVVPPLALSSTQKVTVTAVAGSNVAYEFAPHGLKFNLPLVVTQSLTGTNAGANGSVNPLSLFAGYFPDSTKITSVTDILNVNLNLLNQVATFSVWHFSGYILASGRQ